MNWNRLLLLLMMFGWAGCTQQEEPKTPKLRGNYTSVDSIYVPKPKFYPKKHYIISVDTVGFERIQIIVDTYVTKGPITIWQPTLDTTWAAKEHLLVTPEEKKKLKELIK